MQRTVVDLSTGQTSVVEMTPAEVAAMDARRIQEQADSTAKAADAADLDKLTKKDKAILRCICRATGTTPAAMKAFFKAEMDSLP